MTLPLGRLSEFMFRRRKAAQERERADETFRRKVRSRLRGLDGRMAKQERAFPKFKAHQASTLRAFVAQTKAHRMSIRSLEARVTVLTSMLATGWDSALEESSTTTRALAMRFPGDAERRGLAQILIDMSHCLEADTVLAHPDDVAALPLRYQRVMGRQLRALGYLDRAMRYASAAAESGTDQDRAAWALRQGEVAVMSGKFVPYAEQFDVDPVPGRILHVVGSSLPSTQSGYTIRTLYTAQAQAQSGLEPCVVTQMGAVGSAQESPARVGDVRHRYLEGPGRSAVSLDHWLQANTDRLAEVVQEERPSVIHAHSDFLNGMSAVAVGRASGIPVVYESRGFWEETWLSRTSRQHDWPVVETVEQLYGLPEAYSWRRDREAAVRQAADHVVTLARAMETRIVDAGVPSDRVSIAPNAVDLAAFPELTRDKDLASVLGVGEDDVVVGYVSSLVEYEGIDTLVEAFAATKLPAQGVTHLLIVGDGPERARLEQAAQAAGISRVTFTGKVPHDEILQYYSLIDIFVVPRRPARVCHLVTPLKPFEALATRRTVVLSNVDALQEIADDSAAALTFEAGSSQSLVRVLDELIASPDLRDDLASRGAAWVRSARTWNLNAQAYEQVYKLLTSPEESVETLGPTADVIYEV